MGRTASALREGAGDDVAVAVVASKPRRDMGFGGSVGGRGHVVVWPRVVAQDPP